MERFAGRYALVRPLGQGGMGHVWLALDLTTGTECALKRLAVRLPPSERDSLRREFEVLARLRHPAIVGVHELGFAPDGTPYYTMEYVPGLSADAALEGADSAALHEVAARVTEGLEAMHAAGIVHGDIKPSNLLVLPVGAASLPPVGVQLGVRLVDFGLAALLDRERAGHRGTAGFAAPEVVLGQPLSVASDLYSLGATLYVLAVTVARGATGTVPARPPRDAEQAALTLKERGVPAAFAQLVVRLLSRAPASRPDDAAAVTRAVTEFAPHTRRSLTDRLDSERIVGRGRELAQLERWLAAGAEQASLMLLSGEPGIGKSTLLRELSVRALLAGRTVISLVCSEGGAPGATARTLLLRLAAAAELVAGLRPAGAEVRARLERGDRLTGGDLAAVADAGLAWGAAVHALGEPVLVLLDDHDQLDGVSLLIVQRLVSGGGGAIRWVWASAAPALVASHEMWIASGFAEPMVLGPLAASAADELVAARLRSVPPPGLSSGLWLRCGGHPGLTVEVLRIAARAGALCETASGITLDRDSLERLSLPADFEAACSRRLSELPVVAIAAAAALAVWGEPARSEQLQPLDPHADAESFAMLERSGIVAIDDDGCWAFEAPALARALLASMAAPDREALHRRALEQPGLVHHQRFRLFRGANDPEHALKAAEAALDESPDARLAAAAALLASEAVPARAAEWAVRAAQLLLERGRYREARPHLERALERAPGDPQATYWKFLLSGTLFRTGANDELDELLRATLAGPVSKRERALLMQNLAALHAVRGELAESFRVVDEALGFAEESGDPEAIGLALFSRASGALWRHLDRAQSLREIQRAETELRRTDRDALRLRAAAAHARLLWGAHRHPEGEAVARAALAEARTLETRLAELELLDVLVLLRAELGAWKEARALQQESARLAIEEGWPGQTAAALLSVCMFDGMTGDNRVALRAARRTLGLVRAHQRYMESAMQRAIGSACRNLGRPRPAWVAFRRALRLAEASEFDYDLQWANIEYGALLARHGRWKQAAERWRAGWLAHPQLDTLTACVLRLDLGRAALRLQDPDGAEQAAREVGDWLEARHGEYVKAHLHLLRAELAITRSDIAVARLESELALAGFASLPAPADRAWAAVECARLSTQRGLDSQLPVNEWLHAAAGDYELAGDRRGREQALALAVDWYRRHQQTHIRVQHDRDLLQAVSRLLDSMSDFEQLTTEAMKLAVEQLDAERGVLLLVGEGHDNEGDVSLHSVVEFGAVDAATRDHALSYSRDVVHRVRETGGSLVLRDARTEGDRLSQSMVTLGLRSVLCVPLFVRSRLVGAVYLDDTRRAETFGDAELTLLEGFAELLGVAIENSRGQARVRRDYEQLFDENLSLRREASVRFRPHNIIGGSVALQRVLSIVERAAATASTVLISGENGTGKELIARMLHHAGTRSLKPFVAVNCGAIASTLLESELFGILPDIATGVKGRPGRFVEADGGTLFLDEIGEMPVQQQIALLRVLSVSAVTPVGGGRPLPVNVRVIAATNRDLSKDIEDGRFRQDLWYRLNVIPIELPPLRERRADIPALAQHFAAVFAGQQDREVPEISAALMTVLMQSEWAGNVRELQNYIERLMAMTPGKVLRPDPLPHDLQKRARASGRLDRTRTLRELVAELERQQVQEALERHGGNQSQAARELGLTEQSLRYRLRRYALPGKRHFQRVR